MNVLVTGGAGYIGGTVSRLLLGSGHDVTVYDNLCHSRREALPEGATFVEGDLADRPLIERTLREGRFDGVFHFAALVFSSTAACYGEPERTPITEEARLLPTNAYGESKLLVEQMLTWMNRVRGFRYASLRYFNVAGAIEGYGEAHEPESHLIPLILDVAMGRRANIKIFGKDYPTKDGTCIRDYIHIRDLAEAHFLALAALGQHSRLIYNIGNGQGFTVREVIDSVSRVTGKPITVEEHERRPGDPAVLVASSEKIKAELGWKPQFAELDQIIASAWQWHQRRYS
jgi:UDP-glucose 4-epimerase